MKKRKPNVVSIYSGAGGLDLGFNKAGFNVVYATDNWQPACDTLEENKTANKIICDDIANLNFKLIKNDIGTVDCLIGGPPCPPFSKSRFYLKAKKRSLQDENGLKTLTHYFRAVSELKPKVFLFENVYGFVYKPHRDAFEMLENFSKNLGYTISFQVVNSADYGVPQIRQRFICIGVKNQNKKFKFPEVTHSDPQKQISKKLKPWVTCGDVIGDLDVSLPEDKQMMAGSKHKELLSQVPPGGNYLYFTKEKGYPNPLFKWRSRYWSFLLKLSPSMPSWTIQASHSNNMGPFHWKNRFLRISEIKRIQTFPDNYKLAGNYKIQWRLVGNAVPPLLSEILASSIKKQYFQ